MAYRTRKRGSGRQIGQRFPVGQELPGTTISDDPMEVQEMLPGTTIPEITGAPEEYHPPTKEIPPILQEAALEAGAGEEEMQEFRDALEKKVLVTDIDLAAITLQELKELTPYQALQKYGVDDHAVIDQYAGQSDIVNPDANAFHEFLREDASPEFRDALIKRANKFRIADEIITYSKIEDEPGLRGH